MAALPPVAVSKGRGTPRAGASRGRAAAGEYAPPQTRAPTQDCSARQVLPLAMVSAAASALSSTSALVDSRATSSRQLAPAPQCVGLPLLAPPPQAAPQIRTQRAGAYRRKIVRNVAAMASGESMTATIAAPEEPAAPTAVNGEAATGVYITETPEFVKTMQQAWDKVDDKYGVSALAFAGAVALWGTAGMISAIDRLPLVPGALEVVGIGYTGWFAYKNLFYKPDRQAFVAKVKSIYKEIIGSSS